MYQETQEVLNTYRPIIRGIARSTYRSSASIGLEDLYQVGEIAAFRALKAYDPSCGSNIKSFVICSIRREIYHEAAKFLGIFTIDHRVTSLAAKVNKLLIKGHSLESIAISLNKSIDHIHDLHLIYKQNNHSSLMNDNLYADTDFDETIINGMLGGLIFNRIEKTILFDHILGPKSIKDIAEKHKISIACVYSTKIIIKDRIYKAMEKFV